VQSADRNAVILERDRQVLETTLGPITVEWAWNNWVVVSTPEGNPIRRQVASRKDLAKVFVEAGLPKGEAQAVSRGAWRARPPISSRGSEAQAWGSPWKQHPRGILVVVLAGLAAMALCLFWLKVSWIAV